MNRRKNPNAGYRIQTPRSVKWHKFRRNGGSNIVRITCLDQNRVISRGLERKLSSVRKGDRCGNCERIGGVK